MKLKPSFFQKFAVNRSGKSYLLVKNLTFCEVERGGGVLVFFKCRRAIWGRLGWAAAPLKHFSAPPRKSCPYKLGAAISEIMKLYV